jgi:dihydroorotate dehydrogenase
MSLARLGFALSKPLLHRLDAEQAHRLTIAGLKTGLVATPAKIWANLQCTMFGLSLANPLGLAPGFDKNAEVPDAMLNLGFGFVELGTVTPKPQAGNQRPRLFRLVEDRAVINRMGFNNDGHDVVVKRLEERAHKGGVVGINIGANKDSSDRIEDYVKGVQRFSELASYITINISSPNTAGLRNLQARDDLQRLLDRVVAARKNNVPLLLKIAPDLNGEELQDVATVCEKTALNGVIISNTTLRRDGLKSLHAAESGGLSGAPLFSLSTQCLANFYQLTGGRIPLIGVGGVHDAKSAFAKIQAGSSLIQLYSALVYQGPSLIPEICQGLSDKLRELKFENVAQAVGKNLKW